jgi:putative DNA primase/helicase
MMKAETPIYARGTALFQPATLEQPGSPGAIRRAAGATILVPVTKAALVEVATLQIDWRRYDERRKEGEKWKPIRCPDIIAETIIARRGNWPFYQLRAIVSAPTMRPDGTILDQKGFDRETGILFASDIAWPMIPAEPTIENARSALGVLSELVEGFPFVAPVDRSAALAMLLTAVVRPCLSSAPLFGVSAPTPGTGKSKLVDIASILATGSAAAVLSAPREEAELQKQIGAALMAGDTFITLDNVEFPLRSEFLCQVLTQEQVSCRVLGQSLNLKLPTLATFCATGNSLRFAGDLVRRVVRIDLDAGVERPEERTFDTDVTATALAHRERFVVAALTILRAFMVGRRPLHRPRLGGFEQWSDLVRCALLWLGEIDPLENAQKVRDNDPERERVSSILAALPTGKSWTVRSIAKDIDPVGLLAEALSEFFERGRGFNATGFGHFLKKHSGRIIDGRRVVSAGRDRQNVAMWRVEDLDQQECDGDAAPW